MALTAIAAGDDGARPVLTVESGSPLRVLPADGQGFVNQSGDLADLATSPVYGVAGDVPWPCGHGVLRAAAYIRLPADGHGFVYQAQCSICSRMHTGGIYVRDGVVRWEWWSPETRYRGLSRAARRTRRKWGWRRDRDGVADWDDD